MTAPTETVVHRVDLSEDAFYLLAYIVGMWQGVEMSDPTAKCCTLSEKEGLEMYGTFKFAFERQFQGDLPRFFAALNELLIQLKPRGQRGSA